MACLALASPLFTCSWHRAVFLHFKVDPHILQTQTPFPLDLFDYHAYVSLVAFTLRDLRYNHPHLSWLTHPLHTHDFLNVRTYVRLGQHKGIYFLAEWLNNRLASFLGPILYGLPYRFGQLTYHHDPTAPQLTGEIRAASSHASGSLSLRERVRVRACSTTMCADRAFLRYAATLPNHPSFEPSSPNSLDHFLLERYTAFTKHGAFRRLFHVAHQPWPQTSLDATLLESSLLHTTGPWFHSARFTHAHFSPGVAVEMGWPQTLRNSCR